MPALPVIEPPTLTVPNCCAPSPAPAGSVTTRFHFSLNVSDLTAAVAFYEKLFGVAPAKRFDDYAKFELEQPPLVFALVPNAPASQGALSHMGFPVSSREEVEAVARRLEQAGLSASRSGQSSGTSASTSGPPCSWTISAQYSQLTTSITLALERPTRMR